MKIIIPGGSGQVGRILARHFQTQGHTVTVLSRTPHPAPWHTLPWDGLTPGAWVTELEHSDVCINLTGRSVNCRYNSENRREIYESRICSTLLLNQVITSLNQPPRLGIPESEKEAEAEQRKEIRIQNVDKLATMQQAQQ